MRHRLSAPLSRADIVANASRSALRLAASRPGRWLAGDALITGGTARRRAVALTFDDGPDPDTTERFLDALDEAPSTFFVLGERALQWPGLVRKLVEESHEVACHGHGHARLTTLTAEAAVDDLRRAHAAITSAAGVAPSFYRPPHGRFTLAAWREAGRLDMRRALWTASARDWERGATARSIADRALAGARPGAVILLHDSGGWSGRAASTLAALPMILDGLRDLQLQPVTLGDLSTGTASRSAA